MKKLTAILLLCGMLMTAFASCSSQTDDTANNADKSDAEISDNTSAAETADPNKPDLPEKDYGGYTFNAGVTHCGWANYLFDLEEQDGDVVNDAIYDRNRAVEEAYNIKIVQNTYENINIAVEAVNSTVMSGDDTYSVFIGQANMMMKNSQTGNFVNLY